MGAYNVGHVLLSWSSLTPRARVVLTAMAFRSSDAPDEHGRPPRRYYAGPGYLAEVLYGEEGVESRDERGRPTATPQAVKQVERVLTDLVKAKALVRVQTGGKHRRAEYEVVLAPPTAAGSQPPRIGALSPPESGGSAPPIRGVQPPRIGGPQEKGGEGRKRERRNIVVETISPAAVGAPSADRMIEYTEAAERLEKRHGPGVHDLVAGWITENDGDAVDAVIALDRAERSTLS